MITDSFNSSLSFDKRLYEEDITGSIAHAKMLGETDIINRSDADKIISELRIILNDIKSGRLEISGDAEDIHMFIESELTSRIGDAGKRLHTARSRNDQVALDIRMYLKNECNILISIISDLLLVIYNKAKEHTVSVMPGYTHLQRGQPVTFAHHLLAYAQMFLRDIRRLENARTLMDESPLGACAMAGTTYPINRDIVCKELGFTAITANSIDSVSDRDFVIETASALSVFMMHLSRFSEEIILWCSSEFNFIEIDDAFSTGSSIMPQKKNPDVAELVRGKTGRVYGSLITLLTVMKGLPLAYNKDMQEDKEAIFDALDNTKLSAEAFTKMLDTITVKTENMLAAARRGFINATDCADYLVKKGLPFREAYRITGELDKLCADKKLSLEELPLSEYKKSSELFEDDIYKFIDLEYCVNERKSEGGPSVKSINVQLDMLYHKINTYKS